MVISKRVDLMIAAKMSAIRRIALELSMTKSSPRVDDINSAAMAAMTAAGAKIVIPDKSTVKELFEIH